MKQPEKNHNYELVTTGDGTNTLYSPEYDEHMHSLSGAYEEAVLKHVYPSGILKVRAKILHVLDVGFGLGYNILALVCESAKHKLDSRITILSLEKEKNHFLPAIDGIAFGDERDGMYSFIKQAYAQGSAAFKNIRISVEFGDARHTVRALPDTLFDAVFFDPFSPAKNPELWSVDFFHEIYRVLADTGVVTTYSSAPQVRMAMIKTGFIIGKGPSVGGKLEGTLAAKLYSIEPLSPGELLDIQNNRRAVPYRDMGLSDSPVTILGRRSEEIKARRGIAEH